MNTSRLWRLTHESCNLGSNSSDWRLSWAIFAALMSERELFFLFVVRFFFSWKFLPNAVVSEKLKKTFSCAFPFSSSSNFFLLFRQLIAWTEIRMSESIFFFPRHSHSLSYNKRYKVFSALPRKSLFSFLLRFPLFCVKLVLKNSKMSLLRHKIKLSDFVGRKSTENRLGQTLKVSEHEQMMRSIQCSNWSLNFSHNWIFHQSIAFESRIYHVRFMSHDRQWPRSPTDEMIILSNYQQPQLSPASAHSLIESFVAIETANKRWYQYLASLGLLILTHQENVVRWKKGHLHTFLM